MNIKIGKGGSGSVNSSKGGSGKTNQKKYIDLLPSPSNLTFLFDPIFYKSEIQNERHQILVQGCSLSYVNGIYSQTVNPSLINNRPYYFKEDESIEIYYDEPNWVINDLLERDYTSLFYTVSINSVSYERPHQVDWSNSNGGDAYQAQETPPTITEYLNLTEGKADLDPAYLEELRNYKIENIIPSFPFLEVRQYIPGTSFNTRKTELKNNMLSYLKDPNDDDVEPRNFRKNYGSVYYAETPPKDNKKSFLILRKNDNSTLYTSNNSTLNFFIRLQRPVSHKNPNSGYIVREKRGTFLTSYVNQDRHISFGYRSPYYNIDGDNTYRLKFEPFSFVFSFHPLILFSIDQLIIQL